VKLEGRGDAMSWEKAMLITDAEAEAARRPEVQEWDAWHHLRKFNEDSYRSREATGKPIRLKAS
jgi:hypothetical protein